ncbi:MAG: hypothetical protein R2734_14800 [Nocardioides sp.]
MTISSLFGLVSMPGQGAYNATKYAVRGFTEVRCARRCWWPGTRSG